MAAQNTVMLIWVTLSLKIFMITKPTQIREKSANVHQNTLSFAGFRSFSLTLH